MHELSIAQALVAIVEKHADGRRVVRVDLEVGRLRQVVAPALEFAFELVARDTVAEGAEIVIHEVPVEGRCRRCGTEGRLTEFPFACAACGGLDCEVVNGQQLCVESLEVTDEQPTYEEA